MYLPNKNVLCPYGQRTRKSWYHLWFRPSSRKTPHGVKQRHPLYRAYPSGPIVIRHFQPGRSGRYFGGFPYCLAPTGSSLEGKGRLLHPFDAFRYETMPILANERHFVKPKVVYKNRYAFFTNRSLSPPRIWYNITTTERGWGRPMPGEYSRMTRRRTRDRSPAEPHMRERHK